MNFAIATAPISVIERRWLHLSSEPREIQTRDRARLAVWDDLHHLPEDLSADADQLLQLGPAELDVDRASGAADGISIQSVAR